MLGRTTEVSCPNRISSHRQKIRRATKNIWNASAIATRNHHTAAAKKRKLKDWWKRTCFQVGHRRIIESWTSQLRDIFTGLRYICKKLFHLHCTGQISFHRKKNTFRWKIPKNFRNNQPFCYLIFIYIPWFQRPSLHHPPFSLENLRRSTSRIEQRTFQMELRWQLLNSANQPHSPTNRQALHNIFGPVVWSG